MKTAMVSGSNRGLGLEFCRQLKENGYFVIALCRKKSPELEKLQVEIIENIDVNQDAILRDLPQTLQAQKGDDFKIDLLINNAGQLKEDEWENLSFSSLREQFETNALGPLKLTKALLPFLTSGSQIAMITSRMGSLADNTSGGYYGYRMSKAALNMATVSLSLDLRSKGVAVGLFHPGFVKTQMTNYMGMIEPPEAVSGILKLLKQLSLKNTGSFWHSNGEILPW